jgi:stearoyl-CoA desaturase (Delta-9 desaturase)
MKTNFQNNSHISQSVELNFEKRVSNAMSMALPVLLIIVLTNTTQISWEPSVFSMLMLVMFFILGSMGLGIGFHRYFTHHAFKTSVFCKILLAVLGTWSLQGSVISWVADHRRHHRFADQQYDPHSPWADEKGIIESRFWGWFHAHIGWKFKVSVSDEKRYASDLLKDPVAIFVSHYYWPIAISGLLLPGLLGLVYGGWNECLSSLLWAGSVRAILLHQFEGLANSFTHLFGSKLEDSRDQSRNNLWLTVFLMGEGLHSYHHQNATLAVNEPAKFDYFGQMLMFFERLGLVWNLRKAKPAPVMTTEVSAQDVLHSTGTI